MSMFKVDETVPLAEYGGLIFDLLHGGKCKIKGYAIYMEKIEVPVPTKMADYVQWKFKTPLKVSTPGPDQPVLDIRQYRDRIEIDVQFWANIRIRFV